MNAPETTGHRSRVIRAAAVGAVAFALIAASFRWQWGWGFFDLFSFKPFFADTIALLAAGQARHAGMDVYAHNPLDPFHRPHVYGPGWLVSGAWGLTVGDGAWVGALIVIAFIVAAAAVLAPRRWRDFPVVIALLCSPPVMLAVERANNDLIIFLLLALSAWLLVRRFAAVVLGGAVVGLAATLKMYPFAALPVLALAPTKRRNALLVAALVSVACVAVLWLWRDDYRHALQNTPDPRTSFAYGIAVLGLIWRSIPGPHTWYLVGLAAGIAVPVAALSRGAGRLWSCVPREGFSALGFLLGATCWTFCFIAASNFAYRVVLLLLPARLWLEQIADPDDRGVARSQLTLWAVAFWLEVPKASVAAIARQESPLNSRAWAWLEVLCGFEQAMMAILTLTLAVSVLGAFVRWWWQRPAHVAAPVTASTD